MPFAHKIVLHCTGGDHASLDQLVEQFISDEVKLVCAVGESCELVEDIIDELVVGDGSDQNRFIVTSAHPGESLDEVVAFARGWSEPSGEPQIVQL